MAVFFAGDQRFDQGEQVVTRLFETFGVLGDALFLLGLEFRPHKPSPHLAGGAGGKLAALDGFVGDKARALLDILLKVFAGGMGIGKQIRQQHPAITLFVWVIGGNKVESAAIGVSAGAGLGAVGIKLGILGKVGEWGETSFCKAPPMGGCGFDGLVAKVASATLHQVGFDVAVVVGSGKSAGGSLKELAEKSVVKAVGASTVGAEFEKESGERQDACMKAAASDFDPCFFLSVRDLGDGVVDFGRAKDGAGLGLIAEEVRDRPVHFDLVSEHDLGVRAVVSDDIFGESEHLIDESAVDFAFRDAAVKAPTQIRAAPTSGTDVGFAIEGTTAPIGLCSVLGIERADFDFDRGIPIGRDHDVAFLADFAEGEVASDLDGFAGLIGTIGFFAE